jgi:hypothetical protein
LGRQPLDHQAGPRGNEAGLYVHETYPGSGEAYAFRYVYIGDLDIDLDGGEWNATPLTFSGIERLDLAANVTCDANPPLGSGRPLVAFNESVHPQATNTAVFCNPNCAPLFGQAINGQTRRRTPNRGDVLGGAPGGVRFLDGFAAFLQALAARPVVLSTTASPAFAGKRSTWS